MTNQPRRQFLKKTLLATAGIGYLPHLANAAYAPNKSAKGMRFGLVTYLWGKDMDLPTLLDVCEKSGVLGVELRTQHAHGVEPELSKLQRAEVRKRFADSPVELVGYGSNAQYHENDPAKVKANIALTKEYLSLMHDCGGSGVKVKPNGFVNDVPREKTIEQIGLSLNEVAKFGEELGQEIRVEVHGRGTSELPVVRDIFKVATHPNATVCWNSNDVDLDGAGLGENFDMVKDRFGSTVHIRELNVGNYPYPELMQKFNEMDYQGWILLEARTNPADKISALIEQRKIFERMIS
ncbi:MAG: xylose isomerase [Rhodopirellula sp.]|nr:xylose isomerase [Rhodopirellula sp.]MBM00396.1 xylose isomerase [Rhodopirellula sp.]HCA50812.1 xylose isomerase [Planctomycetaceae bacterium]|tara:strand:+ start:5420 stop:6301 length:882 start_codon:yes stop_codon:yes gene_type:complete